MVRFQLRFCGLSLRLQMGDAMDGPSQLLLGQCQIDRVGVLILSRAPQNIAPNRWEGLDWHLVPV